MPQQALPRFIPLRWALVAAFLFVVGVVTTVGIMRNGSEAPAAGSAEVREGERIYRRDCLNCHGEDGNRVPVAPLGAKDFLDSRGDATLLAVVSDGKGTMPAYAKTRSGPLSESEIRNVVAYVNSKAGRSTTTLLAGEGALLYTKRCANCHGEDGMRIPISPMGAKGYLDTRTDTQLEDVIVQGRGTMPGLPPGQAEKGEATAIISFLRYRVQALAAKSVAAGRDLYVGNCLACHGSTGSRVDKVSLASADYLSSLGDGKIITSINEGTKSGPPFGANKGGAFQVTDTAALIAYLKSWAGLNATAALATAGGGGQGEALFVRNCAPCHGISGDQVPGVQLRSKPFLEARTKATVDRTIRTGNRKGMPAWSQDAGGPLNDAQIAAVVDFLFAAEAAPAAAAATPAAPAGGGGGGAGQIDGKPVADFFQAKCAACHGPERKGAVGPALLPERLTKENAFYEDTISKGRPGTAMPSWSAQGMTPEQIKVMVEFLKTPPPGAAAPPRPAAGNAVPVASTAPLFGEALFKSTCALCHGQDGLQVKPCPIGSREWLSNMSPEGLITRISRGKPASGMPTWSDALGGQLTAEQIRSVATYLNEMAR